MKKTIIMLSLLLSLSACQSEGGITETSALTLKEAKEIALAHGFINEKDAEFLTEEFVDAEDYYFFIIKKDDDNFVYKIDSNNGKILLSSDQETSESIVHHQKDVKEDKKDVKKESTKKSSSSEQKTTSDSSTHHTSKSTVKEATPKDTSKKDTTTKKETTTKTTTPKKESTSLKNISQDKAIELALSNAGVSRSETSKLKVKEKVSKNRKVYEVEFYVGSYEYEYKYAIADGTLVSKEIEYEGKLNDSNKISIATAKEKALARVKGANNNHIRIKEDTEDGRLVYEGKIIYGNYEYEFEIDANSGIFLEWEQEILY